jgi:hypothetical protein
MMITIEIPENLNERLVDVEKMIIDVDDRLSVAITALLTLESKLESLQNLVALHRQDFDDRGEQIESLYRAVNDVDRRTVSTATRPTGFYSPVEAFERRGE